jgi:hypothetical protein
LGTAVGLLLVTMYVASKRLLDVPFIYKCYGKCLNDFYGYHVMNMNLELNWVPLCKEEPKKGKKLRFLSLLQEPPEYVLILEYPDLLRCLHNDFR